MAIDWKVKFTKKETGHYSATFQRFDDTAPDVILNTVNIGDAILETKEQEDALWDLVRKLYEKQIIAPAVITKNEDLESKGRIALIAKET